MVPATILGYLATLGVMQWIVSRGVRGGDHSSLHGHKGG